MLTAKIDLHIKHTGDDEDEQLLTDALESLVNSHIDATNAAKIVDKAITDALQENFDDSIHGWQKYLWDCLGKSGMAIPSDDLAQDRLVEFLQALQRLPSGEMQWSLKPSNRYRGFEQWMWELDQGRFTGSRQVESSHDVAAAYVNFSAFLARLLAAGVVEATRLCALINQPFTSNPLVSATYADASEAARHYAPYVFAALQWILHAGPALYEMCEKETLIEIGKQKWTPSLWARWKARFATISHAAQFEVQVRRAASEAMECMAQIEKSGVITQVVNSFGFMSMKEDEDDEGVPSYS